MKPPVKTNELIELFERNPHISTARAAKRVGCSESHAYKVRKDMLAVKPVQPADYDYEKDPASTHEGGVIFAFALMLCFAGVVIGYWLSGLPQ